jgi:hypothetical protein
MPYCPECQYEFQASVKTCPECKVDLVAALDGTATEELDFVEVYQVSNRMEAELVKGLFQENGIPHLVRDLRVFPVLPDFGRRAELRVAVDRRKEAEARKLLQEALEDEALTSQGKFL